VGVERRIELRLSEASFLITHKAIRSNGEHVAARMAIETPLPRIRIGKMIVNFYIIIWFT
jgi:hypothetical protein